MASMLGWIGSLITSIEDGHAALAVALRAMEMSRSRKAGGVALTVLALGRTGPTLALSAGHAAPAQAAAGHIETDHKSLISKDHTCPTWPQVAPVSKSHVGLKIPWDCIP